MYCTALFLLCAIVYGHALGRERRQANCVADVGFLVDVSGSVANNFPDEQSFVKELVDVLGVSPDGVHASVALFSTQATLAIPFSSSQTVSSLQSEVDALTLTGGGTRIDHGLDVAFDEMFQTSNGMRATAPKAVIIMTDGECSPACQWSDPSNPAQRFRDAGIRVIVIGIGTGVNSAELLSLVDDDSDFHLAQDFQQLTSDSFVNSIVSCDDLTEPEHYCLSTGAELFASSIVHFCHQLLETTVEPEPEPMGPTTSTTACPGGDGHNLSPCLCYGHVCLGGGSATEGNVFVNDQPICDDYWSSEDAEVVCRQIGLSGGTHVQSSGYGIVATNFLMDDIDCTGSETDIESCPHNPVHNCGRSEGAGVICA